jgi:hypothetical protein
MDEIAKQIEAMAEQMEKSSTDPKDKLFAVIKSLGREGLKQKMATLSEEEKLVLKSALEEMTLKKAVEFNIDAAKVIQGKASDTIIQEEIASDDADEKLVVQAAATMNHQGTPTPGWDGQVIKSIQDDESQMDLIISKAMEKCNDNEMVKKKLKEKGMDEGKVQGAIDRYNDKKAVKKAEDDKEDAKKKLFNMESKEHGTKDPKKLVAAEKKEKKSEKVEKAVQTEIEPDETKQSGDAPDFKDGKQVAKKSPAPNIEDNAKANKKNMTKSITWDDDNRLLKANTLGRNFNFNVEQFITETLKLDGVQPETITKAEKEDVNDLIEKSMDRNWDQVNHERKLQEVKKSGTLVKSFEDQDLATILGLTEEEAKKILG